MPVDTVVWRAKIGLFNTFVQREKGIFTKLTSFSDLIFNLFNLTIPKCFLVFCIFFFMILNLLSFFIVSFSKMCVLCWLLVGTHKSPIRVIKNVIILPFKVFYDLALMHSRRNRHSRNELLFIVFVDTLFLIFAFVNVHQMLLLIAGDVHPNPGPQNESRFSLGFWNVDSLLARDGCKMGQIEALQANYNFDVFGICETYLNDSITNDKIEIEGFSSKPYRKDCKEANIHPRGGVCLYFKENIPIIEREDLTKDLGECIVSEISLKNKKIFFVLIYRSPSQSSLEFDKFMNNLESLLVKINNEKPLLNCLCGRL